MSTLEIIRAWKDEDYRNRLSDAERAMLPPHPSGLIELADNDLAGAAGAEESTFTYNTPVCSLNCSLSPPTLQCCPPPGKKH